MAGYIDHPGLQITGREERNMKHKTLLRILVPLAIVALIAGIFLIKDGQRRQEAARQAALAGGNPAWLLEETSVDVDSYKAHGLPVILDFGAEDCPPCQVMRPALEKAHEENLGLAVIKFFDVWKHPELAEGYPIQVIPSQVLFTREGSPYTPGDKVLAAGLQFDFYNHRDTGEHAMTVHVGILDEDDFRLILEDMGA